MNDKPTETYVTFKWMLLQTLSLIVSVILIALTIIASINGKIDTGLNTKVGIERFEERTKSLSQTDTQLCGLMDDYKKDKDLTNIRLGLIEQHLSILVGKPITKSKNSISGRGQ